MQRKRPFMIGVLGLLNVIFGILAMFISFAMRTGAEGTILFAEGLFGLVLGIGLFKLYSWARKTAIVGYALNLIAALAEGNPIGIIVSLLILGYLFSGRVKEAFSPEVKEMFNESLLKESKSKETQLIYPDVV